MQGIEEIVQSFGNKEHWNKIHLHIHESEMKNRHLSKFSLFMLSLIDGEPKPNEQNFSRCLDLKINS
jgi:hypothetical protein